jgi:hypothetical protein
MTAVSTIIYLSRFAAVYAVVIGIGISLFANTI